MSFCHETLESYMHDNFELVFVQKRASFTELGDMLPWEREVYITLLNQKIEEENEKRRQAAHR